MTDKKHHRHEDEQEKSHVTSSSQDEMQAGDVQSDAVRAEDHEAQTKELARKIEEAESKAAENLDGWQRSVAEFQNYKKRIERDRETDKAAMKGDLIKSILPVLDDLERALQNKPSGNGSDEAWSGIELIVRKLQSVLEAEGIKRIEAENSPFDPNFHEAISSEPAEGFESGHVVAVVQNGYMLGDRVLRPAIVRVAK